MDVVKKHKINDKGEYVGKVFVPLLRLMGYESEEEFTEERKESFEIEYQLIQQLKRIRDTKEYSDNHEDDLLLCDSSKTFDEMERAILEKRCEQMRPEHTWKEIAESLGINNKTLYAKRRKLDVYHPSKVNSKKQ